MSKEGVKQYLNALTGNNTVSSQNWIDSFFGTELRRNKFSYSYKCVKVWLTFPWTDIECHGVSCQETWVQGHQCASYHPSSSLGEAPNYWPGFLQLPPNSSVHLFLLPLPLSSLTAVVGTASLIYLLRCSTDKICAGAPIVSSLLCRHICLHHFNCSTDSPNQYSTAALCFSDMEPSALCLSSKA